MVRFAILGPVEARDGERQMPLGGRRQVALLAFLLVHANRAVSTDQLIEALWPPQHAAGATKRAQVAVGRLRRAIDRRGDHDSVRTVSGGYSLQLAPGQLDAEVFEALLGDGLSALEAGEPAKAAEQLRQALALWRGPALADVAYTSSPSRRCAAWRSCGPGRARRAWRPTCGSDATRSSSPSSSRSSARTRPANT